MVKAIVSSILVSMFASMSFAATAIRCGDDSYRVNFSADGREATVERGIYTVEGKQTRPMQPKSLNCKRPQVVLNGPTAIALNCEEPNLKWGSYVFDVTRGDKGQNISPTLRLSEIRTDNGQSFPYPIAYLRCDAI